MKSQNEHAIVGVVIATGISSLVTQLLTIREFLAQFSGNEFVIALILFSWLILGGIGTMTARFTSQHLLSPTISRLGWFSFCLASLPVLQLLSIRWLRDIFFIHGSSVGFYSVFTFIFLTITPYSFILGFVLPYSLFVLRQEIPGYSGTRIYIADNLGDVAGGAFFSFILVYLVTPFQALFISGLILLVAAFFLFPRASGKFSPIASIGACLTFILLLAGIFLESATLAPSKGKLVHYQESKYGRITVLQDHEQFTLFLDGTPMFSNQNMNMAEETIHYPLSQLSEVRHVLIISVQGGMLKEIEKYQPETIDYIELDPEVTDILFQFRLIEKIQGLRVIHQDGRAYLKDTNKIYDAIIVNLPEPDTFQINRFFTDRFFSMAKNHLSAHGIFSFSIQGFDNYLSEPQRQKLSSLYNTAKDFFDNVLLLPGQKIFFLCSLVPINPDIPANLADKEISTQYISGYFYGNLTQERIERLNQLVDTTTLKNSDKSPRLIKLMFSQWFAKFSTTPKGFIAAVTILLMIYFLLITKAEFVLFSTGCMAMASEILVIFAFQIFFGYIYMQIGIIITVFLAGLLPGALLGNKLRSRKKSVMAISDSLLIFFMVLFILALQYGEDQLSVAGFLIFGLVISLTCGFQFPIALYMLGDSRSAVTRAFSADLMGAAFGTLITSIVLIPYLGIIPAAAVLISLKLTSLMVIKRI